jgi:hypothetical protein
MDDFIGYKILKDRSCSYKSVNKQSELINLLNLGKKLIRSNKNEKNNNNVENKSTDDALEYVTDKTETDSDSHPPKKKPKRIKKPPAK